MARILLVIFIASFTFTVHAQSPNEQTVVKDDNGKVLEYSDWHTKMVSGGYILRTRYTATDTTHILTKNMQPVHNIFDENTVVRDSSGKLVPFREWHDKVLSSSFSLVPINAPKNEYKLIAFSAEQMAAMKQRAGKPRESAYFTTGAAITKFAVTDIKGGKFNLDSWAGKTVVLNFWFVSCIPCRSEMPELNKIVAQYTSNSNVVFIGIALDRPEAIKEFIKTTPFNYNLVADGKTYADLLKITNYPTNVVVDKNGNVLFHSVGYSLNIGEWIEKSIKKSEL